MLDIREMCEDDLDAVTKLEGETFSMPWSRNGFLDTISMENVIFLVAYTDEIFVGYCGIYLAADEGEITNVAVDSRFRKQGIGEQMVSLLLEKAAIKGAQNFILEVRSSNIPAQKLYEKLGFEIQGVRKGFYERPKEDAYVMLAAKTSDSH